MSLLLLQLIMTNHADKENKKISFSLPNGGQSKAAVYKQKKLAGQDFNVMEKQMGRSNASDFRQEAMITLLKQEPFLMCGGCSSPAKTSCCCCLSKSSSEQAAPISALQDSVNDRLWIIILPEKVDVQDPSDEMMTGNLPFSQISNKELFDRKQ
jgi:hypothetical protein